MKRPALLLLCLALPQIGLASTERVYRWTDADGVVHYSQTEPAKIKAEVREVRTAKPLPVPAPPPAQAAAPPDTTDAAACETARLNADLLAGTQQLATDKDGDGTAENLSEEERKQARELNVRQLAVFCKGG